MLIRFGYFSAVWIISIPMMGEPSAKASPLKVVLSEFHSRKANLSDSALPMHEIYSEAEAKDSTFVENPRLRIFQNIWCSSGRDDTPRCSTFVFLGNDKLEIKESLVPRKEDEGYLDYRGRFDRELLKVLRPRIDEVDKVELLRYEETSRGWGIFEGAIYTEAVFALAAVAELLASNLSQRGYAWSHVGIPTAGFFLAYSTYRFVVMDPSPTLEIIRIKF